MSKVATSRTASAGSMATALLTVDILYRFTSSDLWAFVTPNITFGFCTAFYHAMWDTDFEQSEVSPNTINAVANRILKAFMWNWLNLLICNLSNQRLPDAIAEDRINKPYRPLPSGLLSQESARRSLLYGIFIVVCTSYLFLGAYRETIVIVGLSWMYNDLRGGDDNFVLRNLLLAMAYGMFNHGSAIIIHGPSYDIKTGLAHEAQLAPTGRLWAVLVSMVILTTVQVQDLKDVDGDRLRGRRSLMIVAGMRVSRWLVALPIVFWCGALPYLIGIRHLSCAALPMECVGFWTASRVVWLTSKSNDSMSYKLWGLWLLTVYALPLTI